MRLLVVNWLDRENPQSGGAETHLHEIYGRLAQRGHDVTLLCSGWPGCAPEALLDGIRVRRVGGRWDFALHVIGAYRALHRIQPFDIVVEDINKLPLFTPLWVKEPVDVVVPHLFGWTAFREAGWAVASTVVAAERAIPMVYRRCDFTAISESTRSDLLARGVPVEKTGVIYCGIDSQAFTPAPAERSPVPIVAYVGRLRRYKGVELILEAAARMGNRGVEVEIAGTGEDRPRLEALAASLDLGRRVRFLGFVSEAEKSALLRRAWIVSLTSPKEGWGITNLEAAACGTPVVASDSPGLRESVLDGRTGFLVTHGDVSALAAAYDRIVADPALVTRLGTAGRAFAESFTWESAADHTEAHLLQRLRKGGHTGGDHFSRASRNNS
ncbi:MAG: glycosyltransferase family 4 protein [Gemmatimonadaceae bacterium]|nr:glycosyltransferase family 4 protein [Gemmatimonadaceae bacterium]